MTFQFSADDKTVQAGVRRIARAQIDEALDMIRATALPPEKIVHKVRQSCKALRALIRIVRPVFPRYAPENQAFREIGHLLSGPRDARILAETIDRLTVDGMDSEAVARVRAGLVAHHQLRPLDEALDQCTRLLEAARERVGRWTLHADGWDALSGGTLKTYKQARQAMKRLADGDDAERSHQWRKHVKYHGLHARLLQAIAPHALERRAKKAGALAELLGQRHDFDILAHKRMVLPWRAEEHAALDGLIAAAQRPAAALAAKARKRSSDLFDRKPRKLVGKLGERWAVFAKAPEPA